MADATVSELQGELAAARARVAALEARLAGAPAIPIGELIQNAADAVVVLDSQQRVLLYNRGAEEIFGYAAADVLGRTFDALLAEPFAAAHREHIREFLAAPEVARPVGHGRRLLACRHRLGAELLIDATVVKSGEPELERRTLALFMRPASDASDLERSLIDEERAARLLFTSSPLPMWVFDEETLAFLDVNDAAVEKYGYPRGEFLSLTLRDLRPSEDLERLVTNVVAPREATYRGSGVWQHRLRGGEVIAVDMRSQPITYRGRPARLAVAQDVTAQRGAEAALHESEARYRSLVEASESVILTCDADGRLAYANELGCAWLGIPPGQAAGRTAAELLPPGVAAQVLGHVRAVLADGRLHIVELAMPSPAGPSGGPRRVRLNIAPIQSSAGQQGLVVVNAVDVTDIQQAEEALRRTNRRLVALQAIDRAIIRAGVGGQPAYLTALRHLADLVPCAGALLFGVDEGAQELVELARVGGESVGGAQLMRIPIDSDEVRAVRAAAVRVSECPEGERCPLVRCQRSRPRCAQIELALTARDEFLGVLLIVSDRPGAFPDEHVDIASEIANQIALGLYQTRLAEEIRAYAEQMEQRVAERTEDLRYSERTYRALFETSNDAIVLIGTQGHIQRTNPRAAEMLGAPPEQLAGRLFADFVEPGCFSRTSATFMAALGGAAVPMCECTLRPADGRRIPIETSMSPIRDPQGDVSMVQLVIRDVGARREAEQALRESEERAWLLFETSPVALSLSDSDGRVLQMNRAAEQIFGLSRDELIGRRVEELGVLQNVREVPRDAALAVLEHDYAELRYTLRRPDGSLRDVACSIFTVPSAGQRLQLSALHDITAATQIETNQRQSQEALRLANVELEHSLRLRDEFLSTMSHELRTPLHGILALSEMLIEQTRGPLNERQLRSIQGIEESGRHLLALINDILDLSKIDADRLELQWEDVAVEEICRSSMAFIQELAIKKDLALTFEVADVAATVRADPRRLKQMLVNLLSNAVKFTPAGGRVTLAVAARPAEGRVAIRVADTGIGIAAADLPKLFRPFSQLDSSLARQHQGSGLGLVLVKRLAELHGGALTVASEPGAGSTFTIELPAGGPPRAAQGREPALPGHGLRSALVVADSPAAADQLAGLLRELALVCDVCPPGQRLADAAAERRPDVIFLDMLAPTAEALMQLRRLKADPRTAGTPAIVVAVGDERARGLQAGAADWLTRPLSRAQLHDALARLAPAAPQPPAQPRARGRVLVVDDNQLNLDMLSGYLEDKGFDVALATSGEESIAAVQARRPDIILMDVQMPGIDGLEAIRRLRADPAFAALPVVAVSALAMPGDRERCLAAGATNYMSKPVSMRALTALIEQLLAESGRPE